MGFTDDDISQAYANAKAASFAKDAARLAGATPAGAAGQVHASLVVLGGVFLLVLTLLSAAGYGLHPKLCKQPVSRSLAGAPPVSGQAATPATPTAAAPAKVHPAKTKASVRAFIRLQRVWRLKRRARRGATRLSRGGGDECDAMCDADDDEL